MAILNNLLKGQLIWTNHLGDIQDQKGCVFLRHPVNDYDAGRAPQPNYFKGCSKRVVCNLP